MGGRDSNTANDKAKFDLDNQLRFTAQNLAISQKLTSAQQQKLILAGKGDIKRWLDRVEESRSRFQLPVVRDGQELKKLQQEFKREAERLRAERQNLFGQGSLVDKTLRHMRRG